MKHFLELLEAKKDLDQLISESINELTVSEVNILNEAGLVGTTFAKGKRFVQKVMGDKKLIQAIQNDTTALKKRAERDGAQANRFFKSSIDEKTANKANILRQKEKYADYVNNAVKSGNKDDAFVAASSRDAFYKQIPSLDDTSKLKRKQDLENALLARKNKRSANRRVEWNNSGIEVIKGDVSKARKQVAKGGFTLAAIGAGAGELVYQEKQKKAAAAKAAAEKAAAAKAEAERAAAWREQERLRKSTVKYKIKHALGLED